MRLPLQPADFDAAIVDLDGTLVDTLGDFDAALAAMLIGLALPAIARADVERFVGKGSEHLVRSVLAHVHGEEALYPRAWDAYQSSYAQINGRHSAVYEGAAEGLAQMRAAGWKLACLTNKPTAFANVLLAAKGLDGFFSHVYGGDAFERKKPDPLPLINTCKALNTEPRRTLMVGDSSNDANAARAAGCAVVLVTYGYNHGVPVRTVDADGFIDSLVEITASRATGP